jgi:hypothetical protein
MVSVNRLYDSLDGELFNAMVPLSDAWAPVQNGSWARARGCWPARCSTKRILSGPSMPLLNRGYNRTPSSLPPHMTFAERVPAGLGIGDIASRWMADLGTLHRRLADIPSPYGDGTASQQSVAALEGLLGVRNPA